MRRVGTFSAHVAQVLRTTKVVQFGDKHVVVSMPPKEIVHRCQAQVAIVAKGMRAYLRGQFPDFGVQVLFGAFSLRMSWSDEEFAERGDARPIDQRVTQIKELARISTFQADAQRECVASFRALWPQATRLSAQDGHNLSDRDVWAKLILPLASDNPFRRLTCMVLGILLTETECERNFARERHQHVGRPRLGADGRRAGLKVILGRSAFPAVAIGRRSCWPVLASRAREIRAVVRHPGIAHLQTKN